MHAFSVIERLHRALGVLSGLAIFAIALIIVIDVGLRTAFNSPLHGATELSTFLLVGLIYLGLASVQSAKQNYRVEILISALPRAARRGLDLLTTLLSALTIGILAYFTSIEAWHAIVIREMSIGAITFPVWPVRSLVATGLILLTLQLLIDAVRLALFYGPGTDLNEGPNS